MKKLLLTIMGLVFVFYTGYASAQNFYVTSSAEFRVALQEAAFNGQADTINLAVGIYKTTDDGDGEFNFWDTERFSITIRGVNKESVILDGDGVGQVLKFRHSVEGLKAVIENVTIQNGTRGIDFGWFDGYVKNTIIQGNVLEEADEYSYGRGAGVYAHFNLNLENVLIRNNENRRNNLERVSGAGVYAKGDVSVKDSEISGNIISTNGYGYGAGIYGFENLDIQNSIINNNIITATKGGYGAGISSRVTLNLQGGVVKGNKIVGADAGFGVGIRSGSSKINGARIEENLFVATGEVSGRYQGAGFYSEGISRIDNTFFVGNGSENYDDVVGSALYQYQHKVIVANSAFLNSLGGDTLTVNGNGGNFITNTIFNGNVGVEIIASNMTLFHNFLDIDNTSIITRSTRRNINAGSLLLESVTYRPIEGSVLIDSGINENSVIFLPDTDYLGKRRVYNGQVDIGPYEYGAGFDDPVINSVHVTGDLQVQRELTITIDAEVIAGRFVDSYEIDYGSDSFIETTATSSHAYNSPGEYEIVVRVTDTEGDVGLWSMKLVIKDLSLEDKLELAKQEGFSEGVIDVSTNLEQYGLTTEADKEAALLAARADKEAALLAAQADKEAALLAAQADKEAALLAAVQNVEQNPQDFGLISFADVQVVTVDSIAALAVGSHLLGSSHVISDLSVFDSATLVWAYQDGKYKAYSSNANIRQAILDAGYEILTSIEAIAGFWIIKE